MTFSASDLNYRGLDVKNAEASPARARSSRNEGFGIARFLTYLLLGFSLLWIFFYGIFRAFPYLSSGASVVYNSKLEQEFHGAVFPAGTAGRRVLIFGNSKVLAGFIPDLFDALAAADGQSLYSYNSGYPARSVFVPELRKLAKNKSGVPDILLLTVPWGSGQDGFSALRPLPDDHDIADFLFPFRYLARDSLSFILTSREHGGVRNFYRESELNVARMIRDRGYYFISEQSHYPNDSLPDDFHLSSDKPQTVELRVADPTSRELSELKEVIREHRIQCYFVPAYMRVGERAPAPEIDRPFADLLARYTSCKMLGPDYYLYPPHMFSDKAHLNRDGAKVYTEAIYGLLAKQLQGR